MATFLDMKLRFREASGRYDLIDSDGTLLAVGGDRFIHSGIRYLEDRIDTPVSWKVATVTAEGVSTNMKIVECSVIRDFFITDTEDGTVELEPLTYGELLTMKTESADLGRPAYYAIIPSNQYYTVEVGTPGVYVEVYPSPDATYTYSAIGRIYSTLSADADTNFWTVNYPELVVWAACYLLEVLYRNTQGANDWLDKINDALRWADAIVVEQGMTNSMVMNG
jgi:hypothetical protein